MKLNLLLSLLLALPLATAPAPAAEPRKPAAKKAAPADAKKKKPGAAPAPKKQRTDMIEEDTVALFKPYDTNGDFEIDVEEFKAIQAEFRKHPKGPLKAFDKANDGALDAMIDRTGINVKLGAAAPKTKPAGKAPSKKPAPAPAKKPAPEKKP